MSSSASVRRALRALERRGFLLLQDPKLPNLAEIVHGAPIKGSWWGHPAGHAIFDTANQLDEHPDVLVTKLVAGKVTFVHGRFFPALIAIGRAREAWQTRKLPAAAERLLAKLDREKRIIAKGPAAKELEKRLLVASREVHTESGAHAIELVDWDVLARERKVRAGELAPERAKQQIETAFAEIERATGGVAKLPWT